MRLLADPRNNHSISYKHKPSIDQAMRSDSHKNSMYNNNIKHMNNNNNNSTIEHRRYRDSETGDDTARPHRQTLYSRGA